MEGGWKIQGGAAGQGSRGIMWAASPFTHRPKLWNLFAWLYQTIVQLPQQCSHLSVTPLQKQSCEAACLLVSIGSQDCAHSQQSASSRLLKAVLGFCDLGFSVRSGTGNPYLLVSMGSQDFGPQLQAVDSLPAVHLSEPLFAAHRQCAPQQHCQLADACRHNILS